MTINEKCVICKHTNRRRIIELAWNDNFSAVEISDVLGGIPAAPTILRHLKEHTDGEGASRRVEVVPTGLARDRVLALQRMQLDEIERRIEVAKQKARDLNGVHENDPDWIEADWSGFFDLLDKNTQAAIGSILKTQGLEDKREKAQGDLKLGLFEAMTNAGLAPKALIGTAVPQLQSGEEEDD